MDGEKQTVLKALRTIPGVGREIAEDLWNMGIGEPADLCGQNPEDLYESLCSLQGTRVDRCMLYVFRCAVYYVSHEEHDPQQLKWWNWKDTK